MSTLSLALKDYVCTRISLLTPAHLFKGCHLHKWDAVCGLFCFFVAHTNPSVCEIVQDSLLMLSLSMRPSVSLTDWLTDWVIVCVYLSSVRFMLSVCLCVYTCCLCVYIIYILPTSLLCLFAFLSVCLSICLHTCLRLPFLSACLSLCLFVLLSVSSYRCMWRRVYWVTVKSCPEQPVSCETVWHVRSRHSPDCHWTDSSNLPLQSMFSIVPSFPSV